MKGGWGVKPIEMNGFADLESLQMLWAYTHDEDRARPAAELVAEYPLPDDIAAFGCLRFDMRDFYLHSHVLVTGGGNAVWNQGFFVTVAPYPIDALFKGS